MTLPLPYKLGDDEDPTQGNFDFIAQRFPLSRRDMKIETPHVVGAAGEPAFENSWVNFDTTAWTEARFWKDPMGLVHVEGLVKSGTVGVGTPIFTLPAGYRPKLSLLFPTVANGALGRIDIGGGGQVSVTIGTNGYVGLYGISFRQEQ